MKRPLVLMVGPRLTVRGGITTVEQAFIDAWSRDRFELIHLGTYGDQDAPSHRKALVFAAAWLRLVGLLLFRRPDLLHVHFSWRGSFRRKAIVVATARALGLRRIVMHCHASRFHEYWQGADLALRTQIRRTLRKASMLLVVSQSWRRFFTDNGIAERVAVLYNPVPCPTPGHLPAADLGAGDRGMPARGSTDPSGVLVLGELGARKGTWDLLLAAPRWLGPRRGAELWLAGNGDLEGVRHRLQDADEWRDRVRLLGWVSGDDKERTLRAASVFLLPSYNEGLPLAMLEAMAHALPVVVTNVGGIPEAIEDGREGFVIEPGDVEAIVDRVGRLLDDPGLATRMGDAGRRRVEEQFEVHRILDQLYAIYDELLGASSAVTSRLA